MKILTKKQIKTITELFMANQIIMNAYNNLTNEQKIEAFEYFCSNSARGISEIAGIEGLAKAQEYIFIHDTDRRKTTK